MTASATKLGVKTLGTGEILGDNDRRRETAPASEKETGAVVVRQD